MKPDLRKAMGGNHDSATLKEFSRCYVCGNFLLISIGLIGGIGAKELPDQKEEAPSKPNRYTDQQGRKAMEGIDTGPVIVDKGVMYFLGMAGQEGDESEGGLLGDYVVFKLFFPNIEKFDTYRDGDGLYGIPYRGYWFGLPAAKMADLPEGLPEGATYMTAPEQTYAVFITTPGALGNDANEMVRAWFASQTDYVRKDDAFDIEYYPPESRGANEPIELWIPVDKIGL